MARFPVIEPEEASGMQKDIMQQVQQQYGFIPGIFKILLVDLNLAGPMGQIYQHINMRTDSPLTKVQREMMAVVVNGAIGGAA